MTNKENCKIVQDLLPNYVEKLTSDTTNTFIEEHLKECSECNDILNNMKKDFEKQTNNVEKEINYAKKYNTRFKKMKYTLLIIIYAIIFLIIAFFVRNFIVFKSIANKMEEYLKSNNYYVRSYFYQGWNASTTETWVKDENMIVNFDNTLSHIVNNGKYYFVFGEDGYTVENYTREVRAGEFDFIEMLKNELNSPKSILQYSLNTAIVNGKDCYMLKHKNTILYFEKATGLLVRYEELDGFTTTGNYNATLGGYNKEVQSTVCDYKFEFNQVTDKDLEFDLSKLKQLDISELGQTEQ